MSGARRSERRFVVAYGFAHGGKSLFWHASELLFAYFLTEACGLPPREMGIVLGASLLLNAVADLAAGLALQRWVSTPRQAGRFQVIGSMLSGVAFIGFGMVALAPAHDRFALALATIAAFRLTYALLDNPQNAILALTTQDDAARALLSSVRYIFGGAANVAVAGAFVPLLGRGDVAQPWVFAVFAAILAVLAVISATGLWLQLRGSLMPSLYNAQPLSAKTAHVDLQMAPRRWPIFLCMFAISAATSVFSRLEPYFVTYGLSSSLGGVTLMVCVAAGTLASQPFWSWWAQRHSLVATLRTASVCVALGAVAFAFGARNGAASAALSGAFYGWGCGGALMSLWALAAAASRRPDQSSQATTTFGWLTFSAKLALALSALGIGETFAAIDYRAAGGRALLALMTASPVVGGAACLVLSHFVLPARRPILGEVARNPVFLRVS